LVLFFKQFKGDYKMSKVGRASRNASLLRVETVEGTKAIGAAETGEAYSIAAASTITLPPVKAGAYFRFVVTAEIQSASALVLQTETVDTGFMVGCVTVNVAGGTGAATDNAATARAVAANSHDKLTIGHASNNVLPGSRVECFYNGTNWVVTGFVLADNAAVTAVFGDQ